MNELTHRQLRLALALRSFPSAGEDRAWASWEELADRSRIGDVRNTRMVAGQLRARGLLTWELRPGTTCMFAFHGTLANGGVRHHDAGGVRHHDAAQGASPRRTEASIEASTETSIHGIEGESDGEGASTPDAPSVSDGRRAVAAPALAPAGDARRIIFGDDGGVAMDPELYRVAVWAGRRARDLADEPDRIAEANRLFEATQTTLRQFYRMPMAVVGNLRAALPGDTPADITATLDELLADLQAAQVGR